MFLHLLYYMLLQFTESLNGCLIIFTSNGCFTASRSTELLLLLFGKLLSSLLLILVVFSFSDLPFPG